MPNELIVLYPFAFIFGTIIGSFLNVCIYRIPAGESIVTPPSHCTSCSASIKPYDNIPILSYLILRGRCRDCGVKISPRYALVETLTGALFLAALWKFGLSPELPIYLIFLSALAVITFIDLDHMIIPNVITYPGIVLGLALSAFMTNWTEIYTLHSELGVRIWEFVYLIDEFPFFGSLGGIVIGGGGLYLVASLYLALRKREGMGMGDVKLLAMIGAFLGLKSILFVVLVSSVIGSVVGLTMMMISREDLKYPIPFGPFLSLAAIVYCFTGGFSLLPFYNQ